MFLSAKRQPCFDHRATLADGRLTATDSSMRCLFPSRHLSGRAPEKRRPTPLRKALPCLDHPNALAWGHPQPQTALRIARSQYGTSADGHLEASERFRPHVLAMLRPSEVVSLGRHHNYIYQTNCAEKYMSWQVAINDCQNFITPADPSVQPEISRCINPPGYFVVD